MTDLNELLRRRNAKLCLGCGLRPGAYNHSRHDHDDLCINCQQAEKTRAPKQVRKKAKIDGLRNLDRLMGVQRPHVLVTLNKDEQAVLYGWSKAVNLQRGGFAGFLAELYAFMAPDGSIRLEADQLERLRRYAFTYGDGTWEKALRNIFSRELGPKLDHQP